MENSDDNNVFVDQRTDVLPKPNSKVDDTTDDCSRLTKKNQLVTDVMQQITGVILIGWGVACIAIGIVGLITQYSYNPYLNIYNSPLNMSWHRIVVAVSFLLGFWWLFNGLIWFGIIKPLKCTGFQQRIEKRNNSKFWMTASAICGTIILVALVLYVCYFAVNLYVSIVFFSCENVNFRDVLWQEKRGIEHMQLILFVEFVVGFFFMLLSSTHHALVQCAQFYEDETTNTNKDVNYTTQLFLPTKEKVIEKFDGLIISLLTRTKPSTILVEKYSEADNTEDAQPGEYRKLEVTEEMISNTNSIPNVFIPTS